MMKMPLKKASWLERLLHGGSVVAIVGALMPLLQTMWTEKPWWVGDASPEAPSEEVSAPEPAMTTKDVKTWQEPVQEPLAGLDVPEPEGTPLLTMILGGVAVFTVISGTALTRRRLKKERDEETARYRSTQT